jgi:hypothetical protein
MLTNTETQRLRDAIAELTLKLLAAETSLRANANEIVQLRRENTELNKQLAAKDLAAAESTEAQSPAPD